MENEAENKMSENAFRKKIVEEKGTIKICKQKLQGTGYTFACKTMANTFLQCKLSHNITK